MTEGISKEELKDKLSTLYWSTDDCNQLITAMMCECKELDPWLPIGENTPKNKRVLLFFPGYGSYDGGYLMTRRDGFVVFAASASLNVPLGINPTHYKLLPEDPKE